MLVHRDVLYHIQYSGFSFDTELLMAYQRYIIMRQYISLQTSRHKNFRRILLSVKKIAQHGATTISSSYDGRCGFSWTDTASYCHATTTGMRSNRVYSEVVIMNNR